jgi:hypothetical protein
MVEQLSCKTCGAPILPTTEKKTGGVCMPCKAGKREAIERAKLFYQQQRELEKTDPFGKLG